MADGGDYVQNIAEQMLVFETVQLLGVGGDSSAMTEDTITVCRQRVSPEGLSTPQIEPLTSSKETLKMIIPDVTRAGDSDPGQHEPVTENQLHSRKRWNSFASTDEVVPPTADDSRNERVAGASVSKVSEHDSLNSSLFTDSDVNFKGEYARTGDDEVMGEDPRLLSGRTTDSRGENHFSALVPKSDKFQKGDDCRKCPPCSYCYR